MIYDLSGPFAAAGSLTRVYAVASGKGGVGKSSVTVNLAAAMAADGTLQALSQKYFNKDFVAPVAST